MVCQEKKQTVVCEPAGSTISLRHVSESPKIPQIFLNILLLFQPIFISSFPIDAIYIV